MKRDSLGISCMVSAEALEHEPEAEKQIKEHSLRKLADAYIRKYVKVETTYIYEDYYGNKVPMEEIQDSKYLVFIGKEFRFTI